VIGQSLSPDEQDYGEDLGDSFAPGEPQPAIEPEVDDDASLGISPSRSRVKTDKQDIPVETLFTRGTERKARSSTEFSTLLRLERSEGKSPYRIAPPRDTDPRHLPC
jgi:hypothetical protein